MLDQIECADSSRRCRWAWSRLSSGNWSNWHLRSKHRWSGQHRIDRISITLTQTGRCELTKNSIGSCLNIASFQVNFDWNSVQRSNVFNCYAVVVTTTRFDGLVRSRQWVSVRSMIAYWPSKHSQSTQGKNPGYFNKNKNGNLFRFLGFLNGTFFGCMKPIISL